MQKVIVYTTGCPKCQMLKRMLDKKGAVYIENNDLKTMQELGFQSVPVLEVDGVRMDFNAAVHYLNSQKGGT